MSDDDTIYNGDDEDGSETIDYDDEMSRLSEGGGDGEYDGQLISLSEGKTTLKVLSEGETAEFNYGSEDDPDIQEKVVFDVELVSGAAYYKDDGDRVKVTPGHDEDLRYAVTRASTESSQWGQLALVGKHRGGLKGEEVTILRQGTGTDTTYIVEDAIDLQDDGDDGE